LYREKVVRELEISRKILNSPALYIRSSVVVVVVVGGRERKKKGITDDGTDNWATSGEPIWIISINELLKKTQSKKMNQVRLVEMRGRK
jgi:hypothetical protein